MSRRQVECEGKRSYESRAAALVVRDHLVAGRGHSPMLAPYQCRLCSLWHLGHRGAGTNGRSSGHRRRGRR